MWALIGGSGFEKFEELEIIEELNIQTPFGPCSSGLKRVKLNGTECLFLSRHGQNHELLPSEINYRANIFALKMYGASKILSISAIGSLEQELKPGDLVMPNQYFDRTKSLRNSTFCGEGIVGHVSLANPVCPTGLAFGKKISETMDFDCHFDKTYVCIEGPYFSTQAESKFYKNTLGANIIGMTNFPESALAREAGICYIPCSFVTDYDCWDDSLPHVSLQEVIQTMQANNSKAFKLAQSFLSGLKSTDCECKEGGLKVGLMTPWNNIPQQQKEWLETLKK